MFKCTINGMYIINMIPTISDIVFVKFTFNAVCGADEFFVCDFTLTSIAILNETPPTNIAPSHAVKMKKTKFT